DALRRGSKSGWLVERHVLGAGGVDQARERVDRTALVADGDPHVGTWADDGERLRAGLNASGAYALEPRSDVIGGDEIDGAGGVDDGAQPVVPCFGPGKNNEHDQNEDAHVRSGCDGACHLKLLINLWPTRSSGGRIRERSRASTTHIGRKRSAEGARECD